MPDYIQLFNALHPALRNSGQGSGQPGQDLNSSSVSSSMDGDLNSDDLRLIKPNADGTMPKINFRRRKKNDHSDDPRWTYKGDVDSIPATTDFETSVNLLRKLEGGYNYGKNDGGGKTKYGITTDTWNRWLKAHGKDQIPVRDATWDDAKDIYKAWYWKPVRAQHYDPLLAQVMFDSGVNCGTDTASGWLEQARNESPGADPRTRTGAIQLAKRVIELRRANNARLVATGKPKYTKNKDGWANRMVYFDKFIDQPPAKKKVASRSVARLQY